MSLESLLRSRKTEILSRWRDLILEAYPDDSTAFLKREEDRFQNPVGHAIRSGTEILLDGFLEGSSPEDLAEPVDAIVRIQAVQDIRPATAVGFVFLLKRAIREEIPEATETAAGLRELCDFDDGIDRLALLAFDNYTRCRQEVSEIRVNAMQRRVAALLDRAERTYQPLEDSMERVDTETHDKEGGGA
jgi:hypothetical protein